MKRSILIDTTLDGRYCGEECEFVNGEHCKRQKIRCLKCKMSGALSKDIEDQWRIALRAV